ncbi:putative autophagy protein Atg13 [Aspergillus tanneri]|uniref:Autophagy-related protein 13 n=1 Tax=Aspergillus tanneri TaxID=1220188 RepID=A0A5M9MFK3_9EURO|nr:autophagy protein 13 [Aspergillus tanneri]KAA8644250.1 autophagy protein 13 [Aspergillus tanneri]
MHQHPRSPALPAPTSSRSSLTRSADRREQEFRPNSPAAEVRTQNNRGLGIETDPTSEQAQNTQPAKEALAKLNQIISNYHTKAALIILHSRIDLPPSLNKGSDAPRVNRWFNVEIEDTDVLREQLRTWRTCDATENRPPPLIIETYLDTSGLTNNQSLVVLDENGKRWDVLESLATSREAQPVRSPSSKSDDVILERWRVELGDTPSRLPTDLASILPTVYKKSIVLFRSLFAYSKFLPAWKFAKRNGRLRTNPALRIKYRVLNGQTAQESSKPDHLTIPLYEGSGKVVDTYSFGVTESPAGPFSVQVTYRTSCDFRVDDSEALLSSRFMGADDEIFRPSLPNKGLHNAALNNPEIGSVPVVKRTVEDPDPSQAYGSLSTFHQVRPTTSASPISALRAARESGASSPSPPGSSSRKPLAITKASPVGRAAILANEGNPGIGRRPSISFQPFKAPPLSASPSLVDPPLGVSPRSGQGSRIESRNMPPPSMAASVRRSLPAAPDIVTPSSNSASPRPAPISRYSSAFSHRRGRQSSGGIKAEDDNSSGRASATSSAQPGSGLLAEATGTSADSIHADDENISEFLKMLDLRKDLLNPLNPATLDAAPRRTTATSAALTRFQRMRDSNAALSDSMSSSLLLQRSSNSSSKQLSGVPPMIAGTSISTASSPGKPISPHTPHTPAIPSRLSSNSIVDYNDPGNNNRRLLHGVHRSSLEENSSDGTTMEHGPSTVNAIDIPTSPRLFPQVYRRSSSAAHHRRTSTVDDDEIFPFNMRSVSLGAEERSNLTLSTLHRQYEYENNGANVDQPQAQPCPSSRGDMTVPSGSATHETVSHRGTLTSGAPATSTSSNNHVYQPRFSSSRGRGYSGGPQSLSSGSGSLARGTSIPPYIADRDNDREGTGSGSNSGISAMDDRRGAGRRPSAGRSGPPQSAEEDEPLLFAMSDFGVSRRSFEEGRHGNHTADGSGNVSASRRGSGRRGGLAGFHLWS